MDIDVYVEKVIIDDESVDLRLKETTIPVSDNSASQGLNI